jgi:tRNA threonylcarbamoyladenosine biosynthesis protein TsaB
LYILSVDSSTKYCSVAIHKDGAEVFFANNLTEKSASSILTVLVQTAVDAVGIDLKAIDAFAVGKGPGSYTGLRVATSVVKGLCFALDKPLIGVNTLEAMALQVRTSLASAGRLALHQNVLLVPMIDARRMEVYCAAYDEEGVTREETKPLIVEADSFDHWLKTHTVVFFGDGAPKCKPLFESLPGAVFWGEAIHPQAASVGKLACHAFEKGDFEDPATFEPFYLKEFMTKKV